MQPQQHPHFLHPNDYSAQMMVPSIPNGSKPKRSRSPVEVMGMSNDPTATATATAVGSTGTGRARRREQGVGGSSTYTSRDVASVERVFQQQPQQQQRRIQQHHRGNGRIVSEAEPPRDPNGGIAAVHQAHNPGTSRPRRLPGLPKEGSLKPPPMLNREQQTQLKHIQGRYVQDRPLLNSVHLHHHPQRSPNPQEQLIWSTSGHHGALSVPRYVNLMPTASASPHGPPTPILKVPVFSTLAEALHHQREQEKRQALHHQADQLQNVQHPLRFVAHKVHSMTPHAPEVLYADASQQQQHHRPVALQQCSLPTAERSQQGGFGYGYDGRGSPTSLAVSQVVLQQQPSAITVPPNSNNTITAPAAATPVMVYSHPHGHYFMAYPPLTQAAQATQATTTPTQMPQHEHTWNPYESVSPSGESCNGFGHESSNARHGKDDTSREASPGVVCSLPAASHHEHKDKDEDNDIAQGKRLPISSHSATVEVMDGSLKQGGRSEQQHQARDQEESRTEPLKVDDSIITSPEGDFKTPRRPRGDPDSRDNLGQGSGDESQNDDDNGKENVDCNGNGEGQRGQVLGKKRGGDQIDKQMSYSGSYFQVSPKSFLQPNKRQRNISNTM